MAARRDFPASAAEGKERDVWMCTTSAGITAKKRLLTVLLNAGGAQTSKAVAVD
jgi:hypothetical protein